MPVVQLKAELSFDQLVNAARQLSQTELERLFAKVISISQLRFFNAVIFRSSLSGTRIIHG